jgi:hypothetical protein
MNAVSITAKSAPQMTFARKLWIASRFVIFGVGGFVLLWTSMFISPYLGLPLAFVAALMMLSGAGEWGRWAYLLVFVSTPLVMFLFSVIPWPKWVDDNLNKGWIVLLFALPFILTYIAVRRYYRRRDTRNDRVAHADLPIPLSEEHTSK